MKYYSYHGRNMQRIKNKEIIGIKKSDDDRFAFVLVFKTKPYVRPIRPHAIGRYADVLHLLDIIK